MVTTASPESANNEIGAPITSSSASGAANETPEQIKRELEAKLAGIQQAFAQDRYPTYEARVDRLDRCITMLVDHQDALCDAVAADFGCRSKYVTLLSEIMISVGNLKNTKKNLKRWMRPQKRKAPFPMNLMGAKSRVHYQPKGVIGVMTPWNVPVAMFFSPLADALGAGNRVMVKPSEFTPRTSALLAELTAKYFDANVISVCTGDAATGAAFSALPFDHLIFTGGTGIGRHVMRAAADNLTPVTLELGGKSPVIVSRSTDIERTADSIISGKAMNAGQLCISPDYAFVPEESLEAFISQCQTTIQEQFPSVIDNPDFVSLINERHYDRINGYLDDAKTKGARIEMLMPAGETFADRSLHRMPIHLVVNPSDDMLVMQEEIFGPILNIKTYKNIDDCINYIGDRPHPLALYYYGSDNSEKDHVLAQTTAGGVSINDTMMHFACDDLPFGGIGASGMGHYHGFDGYKTFSHAKAVFQQSRVNLAKLAGTLPPFSEKLDKILAAQIKK
ncbi:MAG: coniferyl aldehyde dehydrogenase [Gammaproteobacteria bacterium]|nr:coniferyl aldehyde dehydrogenase [Gammaproteobacteria bacterium]